MRKKQQIVAEVVAALPKIVKISPDRKKVQQYISVDELRKNPRKKC